ncbi:MAG: DUF4389 domain-containing protein [Alphaproteobacteria bacterium]|nr:DUF4389 domain-containing protein [Alphaproteobacteria bacterium]
MDPQAAAENLKDRTTWQRLVFVVLFALIINVVNTILLVFVVVQFLFKAVTGKLFENAQPFAQSLATYVYDIFLFLTFKSDVLPWPFSPWPQGSPVETSESEQPTFAFGSDEPAAPQRSRRRGPRPSGEQPTGSAAP